MKSPPGRCFDIDPEFIQGKEFKTGNKLQYVHLRIDKSGMILYWDNLKAKIGDFLFVDCIGDCRISNKNKLEMTVVVNKSFSTAEFFVFESVDNDEESVKRWCDFIFKWAYWNKRQYHSVLRHMQRLFAPFLLEDHKCRRENAYEYLSRPYKLVLDKFKLGSSLKSISTNDEVLDVYLDKVQRPEVEQIFKQLTNPKKTLSAEKFANFINTTQRDPRLNDEVYPKKTIDQITRLIETLESPGVHELTKRGFLKYLLSEWNTDLDSGMFKLKTSEMNQPITHYYINSSHNTYLNGNQINAANSLLSEHHHNFCITQTEMYRKTLLAGCRCIELDCWDSPTGPVITHGPISLQKINVVPFREVCEAIIETAFKTSNYPIVLSLENHCSPPQQQEMANHFIEVFGDHLQGTPLDSHPLELGQYLPSPNDLKQKILLKGSKTKKYKQSFYSVLKNTLKQRAQNSVEQITNKMHQPEDHFNNRFSNVSLESAVSQMSKDFKFMSSEKLGSEETTSKLADLINYFQTTPTLNYEDPEYLMHSGSELKIGNVITKKSADFIQHTARHIIRVYPEIFRCNSSNFLPIYYWSAGCQMIALNFQTSGPAMQMNQTLFEENGQSGYVLKSQALREKSHKMSVHAKRLIVAHKVRIRVISAQLLNLLVSKKGSQFVSCVCVDLYDLPNDTVYNEYKTAKTTSNDGGYTTFYSGDSFNFDKIIKPEHAMIHIRVLDEKEEEIGQRFLVVHKLQAGYRHIVLRNVNNMGEGPASIFVKIDVDISYSQLEAEIRKQFESPLTGLEYSKQQSELFANPLKTSGKKREKSATNSTNNT